jgi:hypothetical protein
MAFLAAILVTLVVILIALGRPGPAPVATAPVAVDDTPASIPEDTAATATVDPRNDAPSFSILGDQTVLEDAGPQTVHGFAIGSPGPPNESSQTLTYVIEVDPYQVPLFAVPPAIDGTTGDLTYTPATNANGAAAITVHVEDDGPHGSSGDVNFSPPRTFRITIAPVNDPLIAYPDTYTVVQGSRAIFLGVTLNDAALDADRGESITITSLTQGRHGTVAHGPGGFGVTYKPDTDYSGTDMFTYTASDGVYRSTASVTVLIPKDTFQPVVTSPVQSVAGQVVGTSTVVVHLDWTGTDKGYGIERFELWMSVNGHAYTRVALSSPRSVAADVATRVGASYRFRVRAIDRRRNVGVFADGSPFTVLLFQESAPEFTFTGTWRSDAGSGYSGGHDSGTKAHGAEVSFTTTGQTFAWVSVKGPTRGYADVYVDGVLVDEEVTLTSSTTTYRSVAFSTRLGAPGLHTIRIVYKGGAGQRIDVDAVVVLR